MKQHYFIGQRGDNIQNILASTGTAKFNYKRNKNKILLALRTNGCFDVTDKLLVRTQMKLQRTFFF